MSSFTKVLEVVDLPPGKVMCVEVEGEQVAVFNVAGRIYAIADSCTHRGGSLSQGTVEGFSVTCPLHGAVFDLATGEAKGPPASEGVACYEVKVERGEIQIASR